MAHLQTTVFQMGVAVTTHIFLVPKESTEAAAGMHSTAAWDPGVRCWGGVGRHGGGGAGKPLSPFPLVPLLAIIEITLSPSRSHDAIHT